ncbi:MAG: CRISPR-associated endonuclease Cas6 [Bacteroidota bacterium]|nr:CRISPR-associated endonuclease Cas6 [Bacteroidota bacterium]
MNKLRILQVIFNPEIELFQIPAFRGAVIDKAGRESILFHNHTKDGFRYKYPLIQYKRINKKAAIICIEEGVDEIHKFFENPNWQVKLYEQEVELKVDKLFVNQFNMNVWDKLFPYRIFNWVALNEKNQKAYEEMDSLADKIHLLERIMTANILSFAKGINWHIEADKKIEIKISKILYEGTTKYKKIHRPVFDVEFKTNVFIPNFIGLGKAASHGYGIVHSMKKKQ